MWRAEVQRREKKWRRVWDKKGCKKFEQRLEEGEFKRGTTEEKCNKREGRIKKVLKEVEERRGKKIGEKRGCWDEKCRTEKGAKKSNEEVETGKEIERNIEENKELCERKKKDENER